LNQILQLENKVENVGAQLIALILV